MNKVIVAFTMTLLIVSTPLVAAVEYQEATSGYTTRDQTIRNVFNGALLEKIKQFFGNKEFMLVKNLLPLIGNGNFSSFNLIMALLGTIAFFVLTQPMFLQLIVETGNDFIFIGLLLSLILIEIFQKFFALKVLGLWEPYIVNDVDGFWNFFSIVFLSIYFKIYLSYLPTFIIQYSTVFVKAVFYIIMFLIPILFNFCFADSIDLIDWNGDETPS